MARFFRFPFGLSGDRTSIPDATQPGGEVSFNQGFGPDYEIAPGDPGWKPVPREETNSLYYDLTDNIRQYQLYGVPEWVDASQNGGVAVSYVINARVRHNDVVYVSLVTTNVAEPGTDATKWAVDSGFSEATLAQALASTSLTTVITPRRLGASVQRSVWNYGVAGGSADAITVTLSPAPTALSDILGSPIRVKTGGSPNSGPMTINVNGLGVVAIANPDGTPVIRGQVPPDTVVEFMYDGVDFSLLTVPRYALGLSGQTIIAVSGNWTVPQGVYRVHARVWGAGGGSGGAYNGGNSGGGGGGGYAEGWYDVTPGQIIAAVVGVGGTAGAATSTPGAGGTGGASSFGAFCTANGGAGGAPSNGSGVISAGGGGGSATGGNLLNVSGGASSGGLFGVGAGGGNGGASFAIPGIPAGGFAAQGISGLIPGGGAGGTGAPATGSNYPGGVGGRGQIILEY